MSDELLKHSRQPEGPLQILQAGLEIEIQLCVHTIHAYESHYLRLPGVNLVPMADLGYAGRLCSMALVSALAAWDGFLGNLVRAVRASGNPFRQRDLSRRLSKTASRESTVEPLARRHCIVHNLARVDKDYRDNVPSSTLAIGDSLSTDLDYLKGASARFFKTGIELVSILVADGLLDEGHQATIGEFQRDPHLELDGWTVQREAMGGSEKGRFLGAMDMPEEAFDSLPGDAWFFSRKLPNGVRLALKSVEAPVTAGEWAVVQLTPRYFLELADMLPRIAEGMTERGDDR